MVVSANYSGYERTDGFRWDWADWAEPPRKPTRARPTRQRKP